MKTTLPEFIAETVGRARTELPLADAVRFLRVIARAFDEEAAGDLQSTVFQLSECDRQLELLALGQLPLDFRPLAADAPLPFSLRLRAAMTLEGLTQADVAEMAGVTQAVVSLWLQGKHEPYKKTLKRLARLLSF